MQLKTCQALQLPKPYENIAGFQCIGIEVALHIRKPEGCAPRALASRGAVLLSSTCAPQTWLRFFEFRIRISDRHIRYGYPMNMSYMHIVYTFTRAYDMVLDIYVLNKSASNILCSQDPKLLIAQTPTRSQRCYFDLLGGMYHTKLLPRPKSIVI